MCQRISAVWVVDNAQKNARSLFQQADEITILRISLFSVVSVRMVIPMYKGGGLNPDWETYNDAAKILEECIGKLITPSLTDIEKAKVDKDIVDKFKNAKMTEFKPTSRVDLLKVCRDFIKDFEGEYLAEDGNVIDGTNYIMEQYYRELKALLK